MSRKKDTYYDAYNFRIAQLVENGNKVLDIGCATGRLLEYLQNEKSCEVKGIEVDCAMAKEAQERCKDVACLDIESCNSLPFEKNYFDVVIFADCLEHLKRPDLVLKTIIPYLKKSGILLVSLPNIAFLSVRLGLLFGNFNYTQYGLLDKTHLRFFTLKSAKNLIEGNGFKIIKIEGYNQVRARFFFVRPLGKIFKSLFATDFIIKAALNNA
ncbi:MAG: class I SAM-dependent methyltransferase [Candidatus Omnitrophica bacterium]|nr:class I SAM-dependent methyltransferase [Candidatus Omnitrophota bacterium]MDD5653709.1 class I SAM-dependent methyltransferase [Candidatus Omnitrophota bacterium]